MHYLVIRHGFVGEREVVTMLKTSIKGSGDVALYLHHKEIVRGRSIIISQASFLRK
jgi:hypothetical protein